MSQILPSAAADAAEFELDSPLLFFNRELSWLEFNARVLELAEDRAVPLLERLKFCAIHTSNLDEFFMVRVAGLQDQVEAGIETPLQDGRTPREAILAIRETVGRQYARHARCLEGELLPRLAEEGIRVVSCEEVEPEHRAVLDDHFRRQIFPVLTPLAIGLGRPFPYISNLALSVCVVVRDPVGGQESFARVKVPKEMLPRFVPVGDGHSFVPLEDLIAANLDRLFPGMQVVEHAYFRVTRDADLAVSDEADDLLKAVEAEVRRRRFGEPVRVEVSARMSDRIRQMLTDALDVEPGDVFTVDGLLDATDLWALVKLPGLSELRDPAWTPVTQPRLQPEEGDEPDVMGAMRRGDVLLHHPYDSFSNSVERLVEQAVGDPDVLAIKQTVYRTSDDSPLVPALMRAAERGKQAVCLVELKARFDEQANIQWARKLEQTGVHVVYGLPSLKTHAKCVLIVRREGDGVRHYVHIGTGNYHARTARLYTDFGLLTCDEDIAADVAEMFNYLTGYARMGRPRQVLVAPDHLREGIVAEIDETIRAHERGESSRIRMKMNALVDPACIRALYRASRAGVPVDLNVRGICCLRPGVPGVSDNIRVTSLVGRFLEHSRIYVFDRAGEERVYIGSADLMQRNLDMRVELLVPVHDSDLRAELLDALDRCLADNCNSWDLHEDGSWLRRQPSDPPRSAHRELMAFHARRAAEGSAPV